MEMLNLMVFFLQIGLFFNYMKNKMMEQVANQSEKHIKTAAISVSFLGLHNLIIAKVLLNH